MWRDLDHALTVLALLLLTAAFGQLTVELGRRTRHWNGLSKALTWLIALGTLLFGWLLLTTLEWMPARTETRLALELAIFVACVNSIHRLRKLPPQPWSWPWRWRWHETTR
jgi:hypothetical protein